MFFLVGCWTESTSRPASPPVNEEPFAMAVAFNGNQLGIYRFEGDKELTRVLLAPAQITELWWLGEPHHDAVLVATRNSEDTTRALIAQDDMLVPRFVRDW